MRDAVSTFALLGTSLVVLAFSLLDLTGMLDGVQFLRDRVPIMTLIVLGITLSYLALERRDKLDSIDSGLDEIQQLLQNTHVRLLNPALLGIEVFESTNELLKRMTEVTVGAEIVSTLNLSPPRGTSPPQDDYFSRVHRYLKSRDCGLRSFRTLASLEGVSKAKWVLERAAELAPTGRVSTSVMPRSLLLPDTVTQILLGFHIVHKEGILYVFFYRPINPTGVMDSFLIKSAEVARIMQKYFEVLWHRAIPLHVGKQVDARGLEELLEVDPLIADNPAYLHLRDEAARQR
jgi:hypothetical protein